MSNPNDVTKSRQGLFLVLAIAVVLMLVGAGFWFFDDGSAPQRPDKGVRVNIQAPGSIDEKDAWREKLSAENKANATEQRDLKNTVSELTKRIEVLTEEAETRKKQDEEREKQKQEDEAKARTEKTTTKLDKPLPISKSGLHGDQVIEAPGSMSVGQLNQPLNPIATPAPKEVEIISFKSRKVVSKDGAAGVSGGSESVAEVVGFPTDEKAKKYAYTKGTKKQVIEFLPAGSFVKVKLLNGADAPTGGNAQSNPLPVNMHVVDIANLPNKHKADIRDCRFIGFAWGDLSSERMKARTETLTCIINNETVEMKVKGSVIGEDGKEGVRGRLVTKQGAVLANSLLAGALTGIGQVFRQSASTVVSGGGGVTQTIDPDKVGQAALGGGVSKGANDYAAYLLKTADKLFPIIEVDASREIEVLILKGVTYNGDAISKDDFQALNKRASMMTRSYTND